jgi:hypothetical protein
MGGLGRRHESDRRRADVVPTARRLFDACPSNVMHEFV